MSAPIYNVLLLGAGNSERSILAEPVQARLNEIGKTVVAKTPSA